jgi:peroxiredoxin
MKSLRRVLSVVCAALLLPALVGVAGLRASPAAAQADLPAWQTMALTNARTGEPFTLADFQGKTVYVEPMATWCTNCRQQLRTVREVRTQLDAEQYVFVGLSVETDISSEALARYVDEQGFDWTFAVLTPEMLRELAATFGRTIANPPATPHFVIRSDGTASGLSTGHHSADSLIQELAAASSG